MGWSDKSITEMKKYREEMFSVKVESFNDEWYPNAFNISASGNGYQWTCISIMTFSEAHKLHAELTRYLQSRSVL